LAGIVIRVGQSARQGLRRPRPPSDIPIS
jgi:hypothetical protein